MSRPEASPMHTQEDIDKNAGIYDLLTRFGEPNGWQVDTQLDNFRRLVLIADLAGVPLSNASCLDVGCGTGAFCTYWKELGGGEYCGYDFVFCSGALSVKLPSRDNYDFLRQMVRRMLERARYGVSFNYLTDTEAEQDDDLFFYNTERVVEICQEIDPELTVVSEVPDQRQGEIYLFWR